MKLSRDPVLVYDGDYSFCAWWKHDYKQPYMFPVHIKQFDYRAAGL